MNLNKIIKKGGATLSIKNLKSVDYSDGYMVGVAGIVRDVSNINRKQRMEIKKEIIALAQSFKTSSKNYHMGLWVNKGKLYIDPSTDSVGTTQKSATLLSMELNVTTGWQAIETGDGNLYFSSVKRVGDECELQITFEHDTSAVTEINAWRNQTERVIRLIWTGTALTTPGTHLTKKLTIDMYGKWKEFEPLDDQDGNSVVTGTFHVGYSTAGLKKLSFAVVNELTALP